jgi:hypothetical protein
MALGTIDILYTVDLGNGVTVEMTSGQLAAYRFFLKYIYPLLRLLFAPVHLIIKLKRKKAVKP